MYQLTSDLIGGKKLIGQWNTEVSELQCHVDITIIC